MKCQITQIYCCNYVRRHSCTHSHLTSRAFEEFTKDYLLRICLTCYDALNDEELDYEEYDLPQLLGGATCH